MPLWKLNGNDIMRGNMIVARIRPFTKEEKKGLTVGVDKRRTLYRWDGVCGRLAGEWGGTYYINPKAGSHRTQEAVFQQMLESVKWHYNYGYRQPRLKLTFQSGRTLVL